MLKKITIGYFSLIAISMFLLMMLLIVITLVDIDSQQNHKIVSRDYGADILKISTDKNMYTSAEDVLITFENLGNNKIIQNNHSTLSIKCRHDIGNNYELAFIEQKRNNDWIAIEPVKRCSDDCNTICGGDKKIGSKAKTSFTWGQTVLRCANNDSSTIEKASTGIYRISSAIWDKEVSSFVKISSNTFKISNISKK